MHTPNLRVSHVNIIEPVNDKELNDASLKATTRPK